MTSGMTRLKYLCREPAAYGVGIPADDYTADGVRLIRTSDIGDDGGLIPAEEGIFIQPEQAYGYELEDGDLLFSRSGTLGRALLFSRARHGPCTFAQYLVRFRPLPEVDPRFVFYFSKSQPFQDQVNLDATQSTIANFNAQRFSNLEVPTRSPKEQRAIADFLDRETAHIDSLISKKAHLHETLQTRRRALVDDTLYQGKQRLVRVKHAIRSITSGPRGWSQYFSDEGRAFLRIANVSSTSIDLLLDDLVRVNPPEGPESRRTSVDPGDVLVSITAEIGSVGVVTDELAGSHVSQHLALLRTNHAVADPTWLALALFGSDAQAQLDSARYGGTKTQLALDDVIETRIPLPSLELQRTLVAEWRRKDDILTGAMDRLNHQLGLLREHRQALITAAVTGQLEVVRAA